MMITKEDLGLVNKHASGLKTVVIGDVMLDRYIYGAVERISPEAPVPVVNLHQTVTKAGGAANVALNLAAWGCTTGLIGLVGVDDRAIELAGILNQNKIRHELIPADARPTSVKTRVVASSHHLLRIDEESTNYLTGEEEQKAIDHVMRFLATFAPDLIILEDYNKGFLTKRMIGALMEFGRVNQVFVAVDPKNDNFFEFKGADLFKPNLREASHASRIPLTSTELDEVCNTWRSKYGFDTVAITLGASGIYLQNENFSLQVRPDRSIDVIDVCGAGDAVICALALGKMSGLSLEKCGALANLTGAYVCSHSGVVAVDVREINEWI